MPNKVTYTITTSDGKEHQVSKENVDKYGIQSYADAYKGATIRMRDAQKGDYDIPLQHFDNARKQGLHAFSLEHTPVQKQTAPKPTPTSSVTTAATPQDIVQSPRPQSQKDRPMTAVEKASMISNVGNIVNTTQAGLQRTKNMMTYAKSKAGLHVEPVKLGKKNNVVETAKQYNPKTGKMQSHYLTEAGNEYDDKTQADIEQAAIDDQKRRELDPVQSQLEDAYSERDRLEEAVSARRKELEDEYNNRPWYQRILTEMGKASHSNVDPAAISTDPEHMGFAQDEQYMQLMSAIRKNHQTIQTLEDKKNGQMNSFWHSLGTTLANGYIFADGLPEMRDATAILNAQKHIDSINRKRKTGQALTKEEAAAEAVLHNTQTDNVVQGTYGSEYGAWARAGRGTAYSADFMKDFLLFPAAANIAKGVAGKVAGIGGKYLAKEAGETAVKATAKAIARATLKATGVVVGAHTAGAVISNTTGIGRTVAKMGQLSAGDVSMDKNGNYKMENQQDLMSAFAEAEREQARENGSEMFGEFIPGGKVLSAAGKKALSKIGLGRISDMLTSIGNKAWYKNYTNLLSKGGYNGIPGEALEEYEGMFFDAITGHADEAVRDFTDPKQQVDIWLGCAAMGALMGAAPMGMHTQGYYRYKHGMNRADRTADFRLTPKKWQPLKEQIDQTDNGNMAGFVVNNILNNKSLEPQEKEAAMNYVRNLTKFRGFNIAQVNNADDEVKDTQIESRQQNEAYSMGYNLQDEKELNNTAILYDEAKKQATKATGWNEDTLESMIGEDGGASTLAYMKHSDEFNDGQLQAFTDYANARAAYNGMIQRVKDDIDTKVHESELVVDQRTNLDTGAIHPATMKVDDRQVYIVNGNVVMLPDGSGVDHEHSDDFVVLRDAETGELETADPSAISKVDAPINVQEEKEAAADNIRQTFAQQQADKIDGKLEFKQGDTYSIIDKEDGTQHSLSIIGDAIDEKTGQVNPEMVLVDIDGAQQPILLPKEQVQQQVDEARRAAVAATQVVESAPTTNTNNTYSINDEVTISDENGNAVRGSITAPENEDGKFEVYTEQPINGKKVNLFSAEELDAITKAPETVAENATVQQPQQQEETEEYVEKETPKQQPTALERIPKDESGQPLYEQAEPETAWDAIVEQTEGDTSMAQTVADDMVSDLEAGVRKAEKTKTKSGGSIAEKIAAEKERAAVIEQAKATLAHWRKIAAVNRMREAAMHAEEQRKADEVARVRKEQEEKERVEQEEAERIKREALNGVPDFVEDKAIDARARGYRRVNGDKVDRQEPIDATKGKEVQVKFDDDNIPTGHVAIIEANQLQPSHKNGQRNPQHFIDEAQPKERKDDASVGAARKIAANIRPEEITSSVTAYTGAPTVNSRGEVIQGNNRSAALREMWDNHQEQGDKYKQYLIDNAESFGLKAEDIAAMDKPVLVNMLDVNDDEAISLGQFVASDTESGGTERIKPKNVVKKLGDKMKNFANILLRANDENISFAELVDSNGVDALKWLNANGVISPTQYKSAFDSKGNITAEAKNDIKGIMYQSIFEGGNTQLEEMFNALPAKAQKAILATAYRDYDSPQSERMIEDIQDSIMAYYALSHDSMFMNAKNHKDARIAVEAWRRQLAFDDVTGESYLPAEKYSNFALLLATMYKGDNQSLIQGTFNKMYDLIQGTQEETLFEQPDNTPRSLAQAIKETLNIEYNGQQGSNVLAGDNSASQEGRTGSNGDATPRGRSENSDGTETNQGGTEGDSGNIRKERVEKADEGAYSLSQQKSDNGENFYQDINGNIDLANIPDEVFNKINKPQAPFRLTPSMLKHVFDRHGKEMGLSKADDAIDFVLDVIDNFDHVRQGEKGAIIFSIENGRSRTGRRAVTVLLDSLSGSYYGMKTSGYERIEGLTKRTLLWEKGAKDTSTTGVAPANVPTEQASQSNEPAGSASNHNNDFEGKDKQSSDTKQEIVDNYLEKPARDADLFAMAERVAEEDKAKRTRKKEEAKVDINPTEAQKEAGNYKKGHIKVDGFNVTIEQPKGSIRRGKDANGKEWESEMHNTYGYIRGTESVDGDHIDIFLSDNPTEGNVFVVDQVNKDGSFDEHKVMYGFSDMESARKAYLSNYEEGWQGLGNITEVSKEEFKKWIDRSKRKTKPFAEYKSVRPEMGVGFDTEHAQSSDNYAHNSEKVRKAINAYEEAQEKFDNLFSLLVKEKESKPFDNREWREVNRTKEELKDVLLQFNTKELSELLKQVSGKDTEHVIKNVLDIANRQEHRLIAFNAILDKQSYITPEYKEEKKAIPVSEFVETDKKRAEIYTILTGVFHDKGYVVGTDAHLLLARKEDYDKSLEGKVTNKKGEVINGKYPNWRAVVNSGKQGKSWGVNLEELHAFTRGVLTKLKTEKANPSTKKDAKIAFKTADGKIVLCYANALDKALQGAKSIGAKSFFDHDDVFAITQTTKGYVICPMLNQDQNIDDNSFAYSNLSNIEYEDGNFSELTAEEPLFNVSSYIRSFIEGNLFSEVDFSDSPNKNVNQAISKLTDDELLKEIAKGDNKEWNFYMEEYDRRHNKEFQEAVERYMNSLEDEKTSLDTAYGSYVNVAKNWSNGGYHTTERTLLRAQLDAIEDYVSKKESEQLSSVESEAYHQAKETVRKVGYDLTRLRLRPLEEGEACHVERRYTESNGFSFTGKEHIESIEDIAYIFKQLETSSVENSFLVLIKDGTPTVLHLSIGAYATTLAPIEQAIVAADAINPDKVLFVHNHPSGNISASKQDMDVQKKMKEIFGGKVMPAIIINTTSGKFGMFSEDGRLEDGNIPLPDEHNNIPINVYQFSQQVFAKDWNPEFAFRAVSPESIAEYVSSHRLGEHKKMSLIILDQAGHVTGNVFLPWTKLTDVDSHKNIMQIISYVNQMGGRSAILYGNYELGEDTRDTNKSIFKIKTAFSNSGLYLMDVINIDDSAHDRGAMEEDVEYGKRNLDEEVNEQFNRELAELTEENAQSKRLKLGYPSPMLSAAGVPDKPIILYGNKLLKKAKLHNFDVKELHNLPLAIQNPIAVFEGSHPNSFATLLEIKLGGHNTLASIEVNKKGEADFNFISSLFGKESKGVTKWILDGKLLSVDKEKAQSYISASALNADATYKNELSSAAKIVKDFVNPNIDEEKLREGYGLYTNSELSFINDPVAKMLGKSNRTDEAYKAFAERERQRMISRISELADRLHLDNIETVTDSNSLQGKKAKAKGFYSKSSGKITIVIPNHASVEDVEKTLLHEAVAHYGLRKLFGEHFETFLDNVYQNVEPEIRRIITSQAANNNWDFRTATEEYLAGLAERTDFERVHYAIWNKIKSLFLKMLHSIGFEGWSATELSDNELRYLLWRSYENMKEPGRYRSILGEAEDVAKQNELKVGNYDQQDTDSSNVAESKTETENTLYRQGSNGQSAYDIYENAVKDSGTQTMLGALARTVFSKDARTRFKNKFAESYFDYSRSIKQLQDAIEESLGVKLDSYEDVWRTLNAKGSADAQEVNLAMLRYIAPLADHIGYMIKGKSLNGEVLTVDDVEKYMNAVHGIERNKHMQEAAFRDKLIKKLKSEGYSNDESEAIVEAELDNIRKGNGSMYMNIYDNVRKDYSGLTALFGDEVEDVDNIDELEAAATQYANDFGKTVGMDKTLELWDKVRALNDFSLRKSYLSGLISKAQYEGVKQMYQYYVPLRGWHEGAAGDIYEYISRGERTGMLESALKTAKGRKSRAGDILGTMAAMANTAIVQGNRNLVAQKFLNMALNYGEKSGLLMVGKQWYEESANEELIPLFPHLHDGMTLQEQQEEIERFEKDMEQKRKTGKVRELRRGFNQEVGLRMPKWQEQEHCVRVMRNGREHQVYVLGNPRAAQAFNGLLNKQAKSDFVRDGWAAWMRAKATMQTSLSPEFIFSNFQRDILTAGTGTYIKFGRKAGVEFVKNLTALNPMAGMSEGRTGGIFTLIHRYNKGTLDMSNEVERMFDEFVRNGGMTGVSVIEGKDEYQKSINKAVKRIKQGKLNMGRQAIHGLADAIEFMNSGVENSTRFAAYMVSRKTLGKSVTESVFDAKEASVNFNMKGSGAWLNLWMRRNILYANPAIQSVRMLGTWYDASPKRFMGVLSTIIATSVTMAMLWASVGAGDGDDDNDWYKLSEWNRYNYLNVWTGNGYAHWSLPQEFRPVWALGQIVFDWQRGMVSKERAINSMMTQLNNLSPMAFFSGGMDSKDSYWKTAIRAWTPTIAADFADAYVWNENFLGQKITNQEDYNMDSPEFQRAGKNTPHWAVSLSKQWNNGTGGAENRKSYWDSPAINPSALYYLAQQQLGGLGTMVTKLSKAYEQLEDPNGELEAKNIPFVSKVWVSTEDKQSKNRVTDDKFWMIYNDWKLIDSEMKHNKSDVEKGKMSLTDLAERMNVLQQNGDHKRWARLRGYMKGYDELRKARNNGADVEEAMNELKKDVVKEEEKTLTNK